MCSEYSISDDDGTQIAQTTQAGSLGHQMLGISIKYDIFDVNENDKEGNKLLIITGPSNIFGGTYKVFTPNGAQIATAKTKRFGLRSHLTLSVKGPSDVDIDGSSRGKNYILASEGRPITKIDWRYRGLKGAITGKDTYALHLEPDLNKETRAAVIGTTLVIDIVRRKNGEAAVVSVN